MRMRTGLLVGGCLLLGVYAGAVPEKRVVRADVSAENLLSDSGWAPWVAGFARAGAVLVCDNGADGKVERGAGQHIELNQTEPRPIVATAWSKADGVGGGVNHDYSLYLDIRYTDGEDLWGQTAPFSVGTHDWERRQVLVLPAKPVKAVSCYVLLRRHPGKAWFKDVALREMAPPEGAVQFDGVVVEPSTASDPCFMLRDVAAGSDFIGFREGSAHGVALASRVETVRGATFWEADVRDTTGRDRAVTLVFVLPVRGTPVQWLEAPQKAADCQGGREYMQATRFAAGSTGRLSLYPLGAVVAGGRGVALGLDLAWPAFYRIGYSHGTREVFVAYDLGLCPEKPTARIRFCTYNFDPEWGFRAAWAGYQELFPEFFRCRTPEQGLWMPFAKISGVPNWEDFGFKFKEGNNETEWDDTHGIVTFRYTEPMTWWMSMAKGQPRSMEAALAEAHRQAAAAKPGRPVPAQALMTSGYHDPQGVFVAQIQDAPWCDGAVWSMNSMPGVTGAVTDYKLKWSPEIREKLYGPGRKGDLDGEYVDSSEGYVTAELDFRRDHFAAATTPLAFSLEDCRPAVFRGLIAYEYVRALAADVHGMGKLMMANSTPARLCWLAPWLDVMGTETNWHGSQWRPMSVEDLFYRRALCGPKPFCFLMNTRFEKFSYEMVELYMKRCLAFGMFPGFFSADAATGHYFTRPEVFERDRPLFKRYVPLCRAVAEAGWRPIPLARADDSRVVVERFGTRYLTVFNDGAEARQVRLTLLGPRPERCVNLLTGAVVAWEPAPGGAAATTALQLGVGDVAVLSLD